jgi:hypothetical protein
MNNFIVCKVLQFIGAPVEIAIYFAVRIKISIKELVMATPC